MTNNNLPDVLDVRHLAQVLELAPRTVLQRIHAGKINATKLGAGVTSAFVITRAEAERLLAEQQAAASPTTAS